jgi:hypothetical protein
MLDEVIRTVNFFKWRPVNSRLFRFYARKWVLNTPSLLLHTEVRRLSRGKVLSRAFELGDEVQAFLTL